MSVSAREFYNPMLIRTIRKMASTFFVDNGNGDYTTQRFFG